MANDLLLRWPDKHPVLTALIALEMRRDAPLIAAVRDLTVFMMRDDCGGAHAEALARQMIADRFTILHETRLRGDAQTRVVMQTRGGNWTEKYQTDATLPTLAFICRNAPVPGPLPVAMSADKLRRRYPHLINTDVLIKRVIRDKAAKLTGVAAIATVLHATDNAFEAAETLKAIFADDLPGRLAQWAQPKH